MNILNRYFARNYLLTFGIAVAVFTFIMSIGSVIRAIDLLSRGVSGMVMLKFFLYSFPFILQFTVPISAMITAYLLSSRLSMDGEINAMKACGINLWQIVAPIVLLSVCISFATMYVANMVSPQSKRAQRRLTAQMADHDPVSLLDEGRYVRDFPGHMIYIGRRQGDEVQDISIYVVDEKNDNALDMNLRARRGRITVDEARKELLADLYDVRIERPDPEAPLDLGRMRTMTAEHYPKRISLSELYKESSIKKKTGDSSLLELMENMRRIPKCPLSDFQLARQLPVADRMERESADKLKEFDARVKAAESVASQMKEAREALEREQAGADVSGTVRGHSADERQGLELELANARMRENSAMETIAVLRESRGEIRNGYRTARKRADEMRLWSSNARERMKMLVETNARMSLAISCFAFTLVGVPLGLQSKRKESASGIVMCLVIMFVFYAFLSMSKPLARIPHIRPDLIIWIPVIIAEISGLILIHRSR